MERILRISGAYDGRDHPRNYGIGAMSIWLAVKGNKGGVSCKFGTSWYLPQNQPSSLGMLSQHPFNPCEELMQPKGWDISYHSKEQNYDWVTPTKDCELTDGDCWCDGSSLQAQKQWLPVFLHEGSEGIFKRLEQFYESHFNGADRPNMTPIPHSFGE